MFGNDGNENEKPGIQEQYETAGNTSDLTVEADRRGAGDVIVGAGFVTHVEGAPAWSATRTGMALLRLHSEWNAIAKPRRADKQALDAFAARIKGDDERARATAEGKGEKYAQPKSSAAERASTEAQRWYANELRLMANSLKSRAVVWEQIGQWIAIKGIDPEIAAAGLLHWLNPTCAVCDGHGLRKVPNQPALSARQCHKCYGTGHIPHPHGSAKLLSWMDDCVQKARQSLKRRLRPGE
jgi:hypothetical protein